MTPDQLVSWVAAFGLPRHEESLPARPTSGAWVARCTNHKLSGLLLAAADQHAGLLDESQSQMVAKAHERQMITCLRLERTLTELVSALVQAGLEARVLKGTAVAHLDYADPALRPFGDIDLLVRSSQIDAIIGWLIEAGYHRGTPEPKPGFDREFGKGATLAYPDGHEVDVHRTLVMGPLGLTLSEGDLWAVPASFEVGGQRLQALSTEARLLHAAYHTALGNWPPRPLSQRDLAEMMLYGDCDAQAVIDMAQRWRGRAVLAAAIQQTWQAFGLTADTELSTWALAYRPTGPELTHLKLYTSGDRSYTAKALSAIRVLPTWRQRVRMAHALALPARGFGDRGAWSRLKRLVRVTWGDNR